MKLARWLREHQIHPESPTGSLMHRILDESPELSFEEIEKLARIQLFTAAGKKHYCVTTPKQDEANRKRLRARFMQGSNR
jgi:hypothetical protein